MKKQLGQMLIESRLIDEVQLAVALGMQKQTGLKLGQQLLKFGFLTEEQIAPVLRSQLDIKVALDTVQIPSEAIRALPQELAFRFKVVPIDYDGKLITLATTDPSNFAMMDALAFKTGKRIKPVKVLEWDVDNALLKYYLDFTQSDMEKLTHTSNIARQYEAMDWDYGSVSDPDGFSSDGAAAPTMPQNQPKRPQLPIPAAAPGIGIGPAGIKPGGPPAVTSPLAGLSEEQVAGFDDFFNDLSTTPDADFFGGSGMTNEFEHPSGPTKQRGGGGGGGGAVSTPSSPQSFSPPIAGAGATGIGLRPPGGAIPPPPPSAPRQPGAQLPSSLAPSSLGSASPAARIGGPAAAPGSPSTVGGAGSSSGPGGAAAARHIKIPPPPQTGMPQPPGARTQLIPRPPAQGQEQTGLTSPPGAAESSAAGNRFFDDAADPGESARQVAPMAPTAFAQQPPARLGASQQTMSLSKKATLLHALIDLLIEKNLITEKDLLIALLKIERASGNE